MKARAARPSPGTTSGTTNPPGGIPQHALIGYLHASFANGSGYLRMADVPADWDIINLAFGEPTSVTSGDIRFQLCPAGECPGVETEADVHRRDPGQAGRPARRCSSRSAARTARCS